MADTTSYNNKYRRYLEDDADTFLRPEGSDQAKFIMGATATVGLLTGGYLAYQNGTMKAFAHNLILRAGRYRKGKLNALNQSIRTISSDDHLDGVAKAVGNIARGRGQEAANDLLGFMRTIRESRSVIHNGQLAHEERMRELSEHRIIDEEVGLKQQVFKWRNDALNLLKQDKATTKELQEADRLIKEAIAGANEVTAKEQELKLKQTGFRFATVEDLVHAGELNESEAWIQEGMNIMEELGRDRRDFLKKKADNYILTDAAIRSSKEAMQTANIADVRDFNDTFNGAIHSLTTEFTIPLVKINPMRMFYLDHFFHNRATPLFHVATSDSKNPLVTGHNGQQGKPLLFINGNVYDFRYKREDGSVGTEKIADQMFLADAQKGPIARLVRNMSGISISKFDTPSANAPFLERARYNIQSFFDIGFQDEPAGQFDFFDPTSWITGVANKVTGKLRMDKYIEHEDYLKNAFGKNKDYIYMRKAKSLEEAGSYKEWLKQTTAGRDNMQDVTLSTLFPYSFFERLNATLNQINLGLSNKTQKDAFSIFGNLIMKRIAPIWAGMELWDYMNYESENLVGFQFEDRFAQMYANSSVEMAKLRDNLGLTDWAKGVAPLLVGGEQVAEIPFLGKLLDWNETAEETKEYWEEGEVPVRKGRWWPLGNTPYTGAKIDYFQPNWVRRTLADAEYTDSQYGSMEEYFANSWMPTPRHPFAPIRHFFTDPYHWEEKHYQDRPYMVTGGVQEIEEFPLVGPMLNATVGQLLKPQKLMHTEYWTQGDIEPIPSLVPLVPLETGSTEETIPFVSDTSIPVGLSPSAIEGIPGVGINQDVVNQVLSTYVTSGGGVKILSSPDEGAIYDAQNILHEKAPMSTGLFKTERLPTPGIYGGAEAIGTPDTYASVSQAMATLHYNVSEMGGFYGFMATSVTGESLKDKPVLQSSSEISAYSRAFWDLDVGGFGGDANEIFRRFLPKPRRLEEINPIENTMPDWLPGQNYFINFQTGDPYVKVKKGEMRLPGGGYEALYGIDSEELMRMDMGASFIGYSEEEIRTHMLKGDAYKDEAFWQILKSGTKWHNAWEKEMNNKGIAISTETYVKDENLNIGGFYDVLADHQKLMNWFQDNAVEFTYYRASDGSGDPTFEGYFEKGVKVSDMGEEDQQAFYEQLVAAAPTALIDPKTRGAKSWANDEMHFENVQQVNFYATQVGTPINYLIHVNRENPEAGIKVFAFEQNPALLQHTVEKVEGVRQNIREEIESGKLHRGDLYEIVDRYRVLADVAPYSEEFRNMKSQISSMGLDEEDMEEIRTINKQVSQKKERLRLYPYRFKTANLENQIVTVDHVIDENTFIAKEFPDNPIRLAGVRVSIDDNNPVGQKASRYLKTQIKEGKTLKIAYNADEQNRVKDDTYKTIQAVVYDGKGRNINKYLIDNELGKERENDYSPAAIHARFSPTEIQFGAMWEKFAHMDTIIHTKMLQVRSPLESYERREVYGKDWQEWTDPIDDFLIPAIQNMTTHNPVLAVASGAFVGAMFGSLKPSDVDFEMGVNGKMSRYGKIVGAAIGASVMAASVLNKMVEEAVTDEAWIPERRKKERDTEEYFDVLKYVKYNSLYNKYATMTLRKEGFDVKEYVNENKYSGEDRKKRIADLERIKKMLYRARGAEVQKLLDELRTMGIDATDTKSAMKGINAELNQLKNQRELKEITPIAARALLYHQATKQTMYGYEAGDPVANILAALPKKDRDYLVPFIESPEEERDRILAIVPNYMKRVLQSAWGMEVDQKKELKEYFKNRPLPGMNWKGWQEDVSMDDIKVKFVDQVGLDPSEFDIWPDDQKRADALGNAVPAPDVFGGGESSNTYSRKLQEILTGFNIQGLQVDVVQSDKRGINVEMNIDHDRRDDVQQLINREGYHIL